MYEFCDDEVKGGVAEMTDAEYQSYLDGQREARDERNHKFYQDSTMGL